MSDIEIGSVWVHFSGMVAIVDSFNGRYVGYHPLDKPDSKRSFSSPVFTKYFIEAKEEKPDMVNHPPHYKDASGIECIEVTKLMSFCGGNCFKYLYRAGKKGSTVEDLKKAIWYAERAWLGNEQVCDEASEKIGDIANYRTGHIQDAMLELADENWLEAIDVIDRELDMLGDTDD